MSKISRLIKDRNFFFLFIGQIISQLGDRIDQMAIIALVYARSSASALEYSKIFSFTIIPVFLFSPIAGVLVDRWDKRRTLYICDLLRAAVIISIPFFFMKSKALLPVYLLIFLSHSIARVFVPAKMAIIPRLVEKDNLLLANSLLSTTGMIAAVFGFGIGGFIVEIFKVKGGFIFDSATFFISAVLIFFISRHNGAARVKEPVKELGREIVDVMRKSFFGELRDGIKYCFKQKEIRFTALILFFIMAALGAVYVVSIAFVQTALRTVTRDVGLLGVFLGAGLFLGSLIYGKFGASISKEKTIFGSLCVSGILLSSFSLSLNIYPRFGLAVFFSLALGLFVSPIIIACNTIIHNASDNQMMGKVFSSLEVVMHLGFLISMFASGFIAEKAGNMWVLVCVGLMIFLAGIYNLNAKRRIEFLG